MAEEKKKKPPTEQPETRQSKPQEEPKKPLTPILDEDDEAYLPFPGGPIL